MLKRTITYVDYNGKQRTEDHYFNLTKAELTKMAMSVQGGYVEMLEGLIKAEDAPALLQNFENIIRMAYGVKSPDGRRFIKNEEVVNDFIQTEAYSQLFMDLFTNADAAAEFFNGIVPSEVREQASETATVAN